jgi:hypothetical protein
VKWLYVGHFVFLAALLASAGWLLLLARVHDRD